MSTPPQEPLVPPSLPPTPGAGEYPQAAAPYPPPAYPPPGYAAAYGYAPPAWGAPDGRGASDADAALRKARTALGWAIGATVGAALAMLLAVGALLLGGSAAADDYAYEPLRGEIVGLPDGSTLSGDRLEHQLVDLLREVGAEDAEVSCPDTEAVTVSTAVVCTGDVDGYVWTGIVFFEDTEGTFVVVEV